MKAKADQLAASLNKIPGDETGVYIHPMHSFVNGKISMTKRKTIKITLEIGLDAIGAKMEDVRAVLPPFNLENELIPMLAFIDLEKLKQYTKT